MSNKIYIFLGPTLKQQQAHTVLSGIYLPPVRQGDIYKLTKINPDAIVIIDGRFDSVPSVWHKEILWAMSRGIHVFGAASMGALRAAELGYYGMIGIGKIYQQYAAEVLIDDDEVAVIHGPEELNFAPLSTAMVDIRATLVLAKKQNVISQLQYQLLIDVAKNLFYPNRTYSNLIKLSGLPDLVCKRLITWISANEISQKKIDALELLTKLKAYDFSEKMRINYVFEESEIWKKMVREDVN